jgi:hypothetical protein
MDVVDGGATGAPAGVGVDHVRAMSAMTTLTSAIAAIHHRRWLFGPGSELLRNTDIRASFSPVHGERLAHNMTQ